MAEKVQRDDHGHWKKGFGGRTDFKYINGPSIVRICDRPLNFVQRRRMLLLGHATPMLAALRYHKYQVISYFACFI